MIVCHRIVIYNGIYVCTPTTAMTPFISIMGGRNVMHYQPKLVIGLAGNLSEQPSEGRGQRFESSRVRHTSLQNQRNTERFTCPDAGGDTHGYALAQKSRAF